MKTPAAAVLGLFAALVLSPAHADEPYYKGKRINVIINFAAGGPTDIEGRIFTKHLIRHIAGQPGIIVQNMDGAGGMIGANYLGEIAPKDGTVMGYFTGAAWREVMTRRNSACRSRHSSSSPTNRASASSSPAPTSRPASRLPPTSPRRRASSPAGSGRRIPRI